MQFKAFKKFIVPITGYIKTFLQIYSLLPLGTATKPVFMITFENMWAQP